MNYILALSLALLVCLPSSSMELPDTNKAGEYAALSVLFGQQFPQGLSEDLSSKETESAAKVLGLSVMTDAELRECSDYIDSTTPSARVSEIFSPFDIASTVVASGGTFPRKISVCSQHTGAIHYCVSAFDGKCPEDISQQFGAPWSQVGRAIQVGQDGRFLATILAKKEGAESYISLFDLASYAATQSMQESCVGEFEISTKPDFVDCCFWTPQKLVIRIGQQLFDFFISEKGNASKKLKPILLLPAKQQSFFSKSQSMISACGKNQLLVSIHAENNLCKMMILRYKFPYGWICSGELDNEPVSLIRAAHQSGLYLTARRANLSNNTVSANPQNDQACVLYDITGDKPQKHTIVLGAISALSFAPSGKSFCAAVTTNKYPQISVYACSPGNEPQVVAIISLEGASVINQLIWPEWGGGILAFAEGQKSYSVDLGNGLRRLIAAWRAVCA